MSDTGYEMAYAVGVPGTIFVGVDGSPSSVVALRWAAEEAGLRDAKVVAVYAWTFTPLPPVAEPGMVPLPAGDPIRQLEAERAASEAALDEAISEAFPKGPPADLERRLVEASAGDALVAESEDAALVVVGSSGRSGIASVLLGSVSRHVVSHARCPVVVVKEKSG